jgi:hypothetical protein
MALPEALSRRYTALAGFVLAALWLWVAFNRPYIFPKHIPWNTYANTPQSQEELLVAAAWEDRPVESLPSTIEYGPVNSQAIRDVCARSHWNDSLVFTCDNAAGNLAQVRNSILTCVRYAIEAGATKLTLPRIIVQNWIRADMDFMFDTQHFNDSLKLSCPRLELIESKAAVGDRPPQWGDRLPIYTFGPDTLSLAPMPEWRGLFFDLIDSSIAPPGLFRSIIIELGKIKPYHDVYYDGKAFAYAFGNILKLRMDIRQLASITLQRLSDTYNLSMDIAEPAAKDKFMGVHLYTHQDTLGPEAGWPALDRTYAAYENETKMYLEQASKSNYSVIYVASTDRNEVSQFAEDAKPMIVTSKFNLLGMGREIEMLARLTPEQQTFIDFLVLQKASEFWGVGHSAFSWNVALKRHTFLSDGKFEDGKNAFDDELSHIYGKKGENQMLATRMWP